MRSLSSSALKLSASQLLSPSASQPLSLLAPQLCRCLSFRASRPSAPQFLSPRIPSPSAPQPRGPRLLNPKPLSFSPSAPQPLIPSVLNPIANANRRLTTEIPDAPSLCNKIAFIGAGKMAQAIIGGIINNGIQKPEDIMIYDIYEEQMNAAAAAMPGLQCASSLFEVTDGAEMIVLGVKPQNVSSVIKALQKEVDAKGVPRTNGSILVSILAGVPLEAFMDFSGVEYVVRAMPNTPVTVEQGCTVWCSTEGMPDGKREMVSKMFAALGDEIEMTDQRFLDMATAISGSGPAYIFLTMEAMIDAGVHMGFPRQMAERLVLNTLLGTCLYAIQSGEHVSKLRNDITSPGGTTASAIYTLEKGNFRTTVSDAVWAAYRRSLELGGEDSNVGPGRNQMVPPSFWQNRSELRDDTS